MTDSDSYSDSDFQVFSLSQGIESMDAGDLSSPFIGSQLKFLVMKTNYVERKMIGNETSSLIKFQLHISGYPAMDFQKSKCWDMLFLKGIT